MGYVWHRSSMPPAGYDGPNGHLLGPWRWLCRGNFARFTPAEGSETPFVENLPEYSTDIASAFLVVEKMRAEGRMISMNWLPEAQVWNVRIYPLPRYGGIGEDEDSDSLPHAICLAALAALAASSGEERR